MIVTQFHEDVLKPEFMEQLRHLRETSSSRAEKETCDRLMASLQLTDQVRADGDQQPSSWCRDRGSRRPKTAMAALGGESNWDLYETTMKRAYTPKTCTTSAIRPKTSRGFSNPYKVNEPIGFTNYNDEYGWKPYSKPQPIRTGTSTGTRNNNPHPSEFFKMWRLPRSKKNETLDGQESWRKASSLEKAKKAMRAQLCSTFQSDYLGIPLGFQLKHAFSDPPDWKKEVPRNSETEFRSHYQIQPQIPALKTTINYGYAKNHPLPANGCVPTVIPAHIKNQQNRIQLTTYQRNYGKDYFDLSMLLKSMDPDEIQNYLQTFPEKDRMVVEGLLKILHKFKGKHCKESSPSKNKKTNQAS
ncbi:testis-expressed protein 26 [Rhinatrema bivittatum]|uniref:testis-expressed protein 26 n=1 Tax=Rhinatrema bivittatum TaxID=194408 RepID=UPI0011260584|nr:testis-expressed protein 26 [Rhinatrema bivittatum]